MATKNIVSLEQLTPVIHDPEVSQPSKRTLQNRKAQREFRERKASYVKSLEQRIRAYESNEVQSNVELQRAARRLKEENDQLREQVRQLSERLSLLESGGGPIAALPPARAPAGRSRGGSGASYPQQSSQPSQQALYNQTQGFSNDVSAFNMISQAPSFQTSTSSQGFPQYFAQQVCSENEMTCIDFVATLQLISSSSTSLWTRPTWQRITKTRITTDTWKS